MALEQVPMWRVICDCCGANAQEDGEFAAWADHGGAYDDATSAEWLCNEQGDWCPDCTLDDPDGEQVPNPDPSEEVAPCQPATRQPPAMPAPSAPTPTATGVTPTGPAAAADAASPQDPR